MAGLDCESDAAPHVINARSQPRLLMIFNTASDIVQLSLVLFLVVVFPVWDRRETRKLKTSNDPRVRVDSFRKTIAWQIAFVAVLLCVLAPASLFFAPRDLLDVPAGLREWRCRCHSRLRRVRAFRSCLEW